VKRLIPLGKKELKVKGKNWSRPYRLYFSWQVQGRTFYELSKLIWVTGGPICCKELTDPGNFLWRILHTHLFI
jgi:hypothetical protein